ncbi:ATP-dependent zinc protease [Halomonas sp. THAF12]|uniref:ATP-dependent zinc protease family protein n=1 Tax=Halomonas sp. B23F22_10 TaxID=3459515 RepID=UPI00373E0153
MPIRPSLILPLAVLLSLGGCGLVPMHREEPPEPLTPQAFESRIDRLETQLAARCDVRDQALMHQRDEQLALRADVREVGHLLREVRRDLSGLRHEAPQDPVTRECPAADERLDNKTLLGRNEWIGLPKVGTFLEARVDSGANTSSLSATEITSFERDGEDWVRFKLGLNDEDAVVEAVRDDWIEAPVERRVKVVQAAGEESRPVIRLLMTLGPLREAVEFTLNDRTHLDYPVLLGRRFLMDIAIVDVARRHVYDRPEYPSSSAAEADAAPETQDDAPAP